MLVVIPFEVMLDAGTVSDPEGFGNVAGVAQNRISKQRVDILQACFRPIAPSVTPVTARTAAALPPYRHPESNLHSVTLSA
jgi:hypothetical protein